MDQMKKAKTRIDLINDRLAFEFASILPGFKSTTMTEAEFAAKEAKFKASNVTWLPIKKGDSHGR
jgi:hypothetical protein